VKNTEQQHRHCHTSTKLMWRKPFRNWFSYNVIEFVVGMGPGMVLPPMQHVPPPQQFHAVPPSSTTGKL